MQCPLPALSNVPYLIARRFHHGFVRPRKWFHPCFVALREMLVPVRTSVRAQVSAGARALKLRWSWAAYPLRVTSGLRCAHARSPLCPHQRTLSAWQSASSGLGLTGLPGLVVLALKSFQTDKRKTVAGSVQRRNVRPTEVPCRNVSGSNDSVCLAHQANNLQILLLERQPELSGFLAEGFGAVTCQGWMPCRRRWAFR